MRVPRLDKWQEADEPALVRGCLAGDAQAMTELVRRYQAQVFGICLRLVNDRQEAEDLAQEVFWRVFRSLRRWDTRRPLKPWILAIAVNRCRTALARRKRRPMPVELPELVARPYGEPDGELVSALAHALDHLPGLQRRAFVLFHEQGWSCADVAAALQRPVGTIKTWLFRARAEIQRYLRQRGLLGDSWG
ncbi:MAG: RNA polymerase sigma factor [Gemmataceae bacterium]